MSLLIAALRRVYAALLLLLPGEVRRRHGVEMRHASRQLVEDTQRRRGTAAALAAALAECADVIAAAARASRRAPGELRQDLGYAWRLLTARPGFAVVVVATLAIGIGATTTVFTVVSALLLRPLPYADPDRLVMLHSTSPRGLQRAVSPRDFHDLTGAMPSVASATAFTDEQINLTGGGEPERLDSARVTWNFFDVMRSPFAAGRGFLPGEGVPGSERVVVVSHALWQRRLGGRAQAIGTPLLLDGVPHTIVGVADPLMAFPGRPQIWRPLVFTPRQLDPSQRGARWVTVVARLKPDVAITGADAEVGAAAAQLAADFPRTHRGRGAVMQPLQMALVGEMRPGLLALFAAVALVLLAACANVASLLLARASGRSGEMAVRLALGASRARLLRQCLAENLLIAAIASAAGLMLAAWGTRALVTWLPESLPRAHEIGIDWRVAAFTVATAVAVAVALAAVTALGLRGQLAQTGVRTTPGGARAIRRALVVAEVAVALVLLAGAGLFVKSLVNLYGVRPGFDAANVLTFSVTMPEASYPTAEQVGRFVEELRTRLGEVPGVEAAAGVFGLPLTDEFGAGSTFNQIGRATDPDDEPSAAMRVVTADYFRTLRIRVVAGREFTPRDTGAAPPVAVINAAAARRYWPGENPIGQALRLHVGLTSVKQTPREIVGVVDDVRYAGLDVETQPEIYIPHAQHPVDGLVMTLRTAGEPRLAINAARAALHRLDPNMPMASIATMEEIVAESTAARRFSLLLLAGFATTALFLAALGIYGVLSYTVGQRTREIGVRMAMGAPRAHVLRLVVGEGLGLVAVGLAVGGAVSVAVTGAIRGLLYQVQPSDPSTLAVVAALLLAVALAASYVPARRAAAVDPAKALRAD